MAMSAYLPVDWVSWCGVWLLAFAVAWSVMAFLHDVMLNYLPVDRVSWLDAALLALALVISLIATVLLSMTADDEMRGHG